MQAWSRAKTDGYFDNSAILKQFEQLFQLLEFKTILKIPKKLFLSITQEHIRLKNLTKRFFLKNQGRIAHTTI